MNLRQLAEADLKATLEDGVSGFGWPVEVTDPDGNTSVGLYGRSGDIAQTVDPDTGQLVNGRLATVTLRIASLQPAGLSGLPRNVSDRTKKPWLVRFTDINGGTHNFKVRTASPDRTLGTVTCVLEAYQL